MEPRFVSRYLLARESVDRFGDVVGRLSHDSTTEELVFLVRAGWTEGDARRLTRRERHARLHIVARLNQQEAEAIERASQKR